MILSLAVLSYPNCKTNLSPAGKYFSYMSVSAHNDLTLWQAFREGNGDAFAAIYRRYFSNLYEYGARLVDDNELLKDAIHDLFVKLWANKLNLGSVSNIKSYLLVSLRSIILNKQIQQRKKKTVEVGEEHFFKLNFAQDVVPAEQEHFSEQSKMLLSAINQLSPRQKEIIYLRYFEELGYEEIAGILNISVKGTYKLSARALEALRGLMNASTPVVILALALLKKEIFG